MRLALRELLRRPGRFVVAGGALTLLMVLLLFIGGLLDGLFLDSTGAVRAVDGDAVVVSDDARQSLLRSRIDPATRAEVTAVAGVGDVGGLGLSLLGVAIPGRDEIADGAIVGYELASDSLPSPPPPGQAHADRDLADFGLSLGDTVLVGPARVPVAVVGWVEDANYLGQYGLWVEPETWRTIQNANRPDAVVAAGEFQALVVRAGDGIEAGALRDAIDAATGTTESLSEDEAVLAIPGIREQEVIFTAIIGVTVLVVGIVVALFFALLTLERTALYAALKAIGAPDRTLLAGLALQALLVATGAIVLGGGLTLLLAEAVPPEVPLQIEPSRAVVLAVLVALTAVAGGLVSLRRIIRIDPAAAIGTGT